MNKSSVSYLSRFLALVYVALATQSSIFGQASYGAITGTITDPSDRVIPRAKIEVFAEDRGQQYKVETNDSGNYLLTQLRPGSYRIKIQADGFQTTVRAGIPVEADKTTRVEFGEMTAAQVKPDPTRVVIRGQIGK